MRSLTIELTGKQVWQLRENLIVLTSEDIKHVPALKVCANKIAEILFGAGL